MPKPKVLEPVNDVSGRAEPFLRKIESFEAEIESAKSAFMLTCKGKRSRISETYKDAKDEGVSPAALKAVVRQRKLQRKIDGLAAGLDLDEVATYRELAAAFGPLGQAAAIRAGYGDAGDAKAAQRAADHERGLQTVGRGPVA